MKLLVATWDGAGNLPPILALIRALAQRGHEIHALAHDVQRAQIEAAGAVFIAFASAPQWDMGARHTFGAEFFEVFMAFDKAAGPELLAAVDRFGPDAILVDCMLPTALTFVRQKGPRTIALVHGLYSFFSNFADGLFRDPIDGADLALGLTYKAFDPNAVLPPNFRFVGPARPDLDAAPWPRRLPGKPLVVASQSSGLQSESQVELLQRVCDALAALDVEALVTTGRGIEPEALRPGPNTMVERLVPHDASLAEAALLITHAGHGSVMAALRFGVPMLCLPPVADQPYNAEKVADLGLGAVLDPSASADTIREAVARLLADQAMRERARAVAAEVAKEPGLETALRLIETPAPAALTAPAR